MEQFDHEWVCPVPNSGDELPSCYDRPSPEAMREVRPITRVAIWDIDRDAATRCVETLRSRGIDAEAAADLEASAGCADIVSCATLATSPVVRRDWLRAGTHLDLIGSFTPQMQEAEPSCFADARVWVDTQEAMAKSGDLLHAFEAGALAPSDIAGDLALLCLEGTSGRRTSEERTVFKAVGTALEDLAAAAMIYRQLARSH